MGNCITTKSSKRTGTTRSRSVKRRIRSNKPVKTQTITNPENINGLEEQGIKRGIQGKKAVLVGLNYTGTRSALQGCINDAHRMEKTLRSKFGYTDITVLTDRNITPQNNILQVLDNLIDSKNNSLYFQYSGHGTQQPDLNGDEPDRLDEALYSVKGTIITDDQLNMRIQRIPVGTRMVLIIDACHSGTMIDLPYQLKNGQIIKINNNRVDGDVICISGCRDNQVSMDINAGHTAYGAMSNALQSVINRIDISKTTWRSLTEEIRKELKKNRMAQVPQLCVSRPELVNTLVQL